MKRNEDVRSKRLVFAASCIMNVNNKVRELARYKGMCSQLVSILDKFDIGIQQLDCPETLYLGVQRWSATKNLYECAGYRRFCRELAGKTVDYLESYYQMDYEVVGFLCINGSPSCGYDITCYDKDWGGTPKDFIGKSTFCPGKGVFVEELEKEIQSRNLLMPAFYGLDMEDMSVSLDKVADRLEQLLNVKYCGKKVE